MRLMLGRQQAVTFVLKASIRIHGRVLHRLVIIVQLGITEINMLTLILFVKLAQEVGTTSSEVGQIVMHVSVVNIMRMQAHIRTVKTAKLECFKLLRKGMIVQSVRLESTN